MSDIDYALLQGQTPGDPPDGTRDATLVRAELVDLDKGTNLVTEWQGEGYNWVAWFGFSENRISYAQDFLDAVGVDRSKITDDDAFTEALSEVVGAEFRVRTEHTASGYLNTYVLPRLAGTPGQTSLDDVPIDTTDLPPAPAREEDIEIPF